MQLTRRALIRVHISTEAQNDKFKHLILEKLKHPTSDHVPFV